MFEEKGTLHIGVEHDGKLCREFTLRPLKMRDSVEARSSADAARLAENDEYMGLYLLGRRLTLAGVPREAMTLDLMLDLWDEDVNAVMAVDKRLANALARFRRAPAVASATGAGAHEDGVQLSGGPGNGRGGDQGVDRSLGEAQEPEGRPGEEVQGPAESP